MMKFLKKLAAVPVRVLAKVLAVGGLLDTAGLWSIVFKLTTSGADGQNLLYTIYLKYGLDEAETAAESIIAMTQSAQPASLIASIEFHEGKIDQAHRWLKLAAEKNTIDLEHLLIVELYLSEIFPEYDKKNIVDRILSVNYLPMEVTRLALIEKAFLALEEKDWALADKIAERILIVEEHFAARIVKAALALLNKRIDEAEKLLTKAQQKVMPAQFYPMASHALLCIGNAEMAMEYLCRAGKLDRRLVQSNTILGSLARSQEFADYCSRRNKQ
jgi:hypothetical protein